jgi:hypothetical protein
LDERNEDIWRGFKMRGTPTTPHAKPIIKDDDYG